MNFIALTFVFLLTIMPYVAIAQPSISVDPNQLEIDLFNGELWETVVNISNHGEENLDWIAAVIYYAAPDEFQEEPDWIGLNVRLGIVEPGSDMDAIVLIRGGAMPEGNYGGEIHFLSNDPDNQDVIVDIQLHLYAAPDIDVVWPVDADFPNSIDFDNYFQNNIWAERNYSLPVSMRNLGTVELIIDELEVDNDLFQIEPITLVIAPGDESHFGISFQSDDIGRYETRLLVFSNDPDEGRIWIDIAATVLFPPILRIGEEDIGAGEIEEGDSLAIRFSNQGRSVLRWSAEFDTAAVFGNPADWIEITPNQGETEQGNDAEFVLHFGQPPARIESDFILLHLYSNDPDLSVQAIRIYLTWTRAEYSDPILPGFFHLATPFPNPFNSTTTIRFSLESAQSAQSADRLTIHDLTGRLVHQFDTQALRHSGTQSLVWNASDFPAGVYLIRLESGSKSHTVKTILMK